jgi:hypothetical protein
VNHYVAERLYLYLGRDVHAYPHYSGYVAFFRVVLGKGAFQNDNEFDLNDDPFGFDAGLSKLMGKKPRPAPKDRKDLIPGDDDELRDTSLDTKNAVDKTIDSDNLPHDVSEYGYGFWFRFLTTHPTHLL